VKTQRKMNKKVREHGDTIVECIKAADELEKLIGEEVASGSLIEGSPKHNTAKKTLKDLRNSIGLAKRRGR
jgi:hypothetical protein